MCGITGFYNFKGPINPECIKRMTNSLRHRGPDDEGFLAVDSKSGKVVSITGSDSKTHGPRIEEFNGSANLFLGHRRLSVIDLSSAGHQPMSDEDGSLWIVYNGEVYNYLEIRKELELLGHRMKSQTDTEVILYAYEEWGIDCLRHFNGMWAFAIFDLKRNRIFCSRDRAGVKPFYYLYDGKRFSFASEIKALFEIENFSIEPNEQIAADYLFSGLIDHTNETFYKKVYQLRPGEYLLVEQNQLKVQSYWDIEAREVFFVRDSDYAERFFELFQDSIRLRLRSDVPIGTCLSGGLDSSSIVCLANKLVFNGQSIDPRLVGERQKTFSSCFENPAYDERRFIEFVINQTGAEKNYVFPKAENLFKDLSKLIWHQDEPFGSTSIYAQWNVMGLARERGVTVLLDGQGGDELLAGYPSSFYFLFSQKLKRLDLIGLIKEVKGFHSNHMIMPRQFTTRMLDGLLPNWIKPFFQDQLKTGMEWVREEFKKRHFRIFPIPKKFTNDLNNYLYHIFRHTMLPGLLRYEDRNSMAFSLETRLPFLDYRIVEYVFSLPPEQKIKQGLTKVILRDAMGDILPEEVRNRRDKMGFVTPEDVWFRTVLRDQIYDIISSKSFSERGYFNTGKLKEIFNNHCSGKINNGAVIWRCVNLELWFRVFIDPKSS
jgi:asparagine synthase (glutamine-hydrolysing)